MKQVLAMQFLGERQVMGSALGSTRLSVDVPRLVDLYQHQRLKLDELITARYPLEQINEAIETAYNTQAGKNKEVGFAPSAILLADDPRFICR